MSHKREIIHYSSDEKKEEIVTKKVSSFPFRSQANGVKSP